MVRRRALLQPLVIGRHDGLVSYTVGQRRGLGVSGTAPQYVLKLDSERNVVIVGDDRDLLERKLSCTFSWIEGTLVDDAAGVCAQIRYRHEPAAVRTLIVDGSCGRVEFEEPQRAICPGQTIAFYQGDLVVASGVIDHAGFA